MAVGLGQAPAFRAWEQEVATGDRKRGTLKRRWGTDTRQGSGSSSGQFPHGREAQTCPRDPQELLNRSRD